MISRVVFPGVTDAVANRWEAEILVVALLLVFICVNRRNLRMKQERTVRRWRRCTQIWHEQERQPLSERPWQ